MAYFISSTKRENANPRSNSKFGDKKKSNNKTSDNKRGKSNTPFLWEQYGVSLGAIRRFSESNSAFC